MPSFTTTHIALLLSTIAFSPLINAQTLPESTFVGVYTQGDVDSQAQLFLLDDNTFCFTFMGGSLDLLKAGRWEKNSANATINLLEYRPDAQLYPAIGKNLDRLGTLKVAINFDGYSLSNARSPVFAVSNTDAQPASFRPLFPRGKSNWAGTYSLPLMLPENAKYFFIGDVEVDKYEKPLKLRVTQYKIENYDTVRIGFDELQASPAMNANALLINNVLQMNGSKFGSKQPLDGDTANDVRLQCINPILLPENSNATADKTQKKLLGNAELLKPIKRFNLEVSAVVGAPIFDDADKSATKGIDSLDELIEAEQALLQAAFNRAKEDSQSVDGFMQLVKNLAEKKRFKRHAPLVVKLYAELMTAHVAKGQFVLAEKMFFNFMENIYPLTIGLKDAAMHYSLSVIASQGLIITSAIKNADISKLVFAKLLGEQFDITTHENRTLINNLACYYAILDNKTAMLEAIKQARKRKLPTKQFMGDTDFKNYWLDVDFLNAIN